jgi:pantoate--beta-alanine ligase
MTVIDTVEALRTKLASRIGSVGFVPTMGALHTGHARLLQVARPQNHLVLASIFVNPLQFDRKEDLQQYPRTFDADLELCREQKVDIVFAPSAAQVYPDGQPLTSVEVPSLSRTLCGAFRPGHFRGVCTVVLKLFHLVSPTRAYFGQKDAQQVAIIRRMTRDLNLPIEIVSVPTVREADGLAMSSRNGHLNPKEREFAPRLYGALQTVSAALDKGERSVSRLRQLAAHCLPDTVIEYFDFVDTETLQPLPIIDRDTLIAAAIWLGKTRLIDNLTWRFR